MNAHAYANYSNCLILSFRYLVLDEADRMIDLGFEEDIRTIFSYFKVHNNCYLIIHDWQSQVMYYSGTSLLRTSIYRTETSVL